MSYDGNLARPLVFAPLAWLKLQFLCHAGPTEVAGFGLSHPDDPLYLEDVLIVRQRCTEATVALDDAAVADLFDDMADAGIPPSRFARIWVHTHPGASVTPSGIDEETFARVFGNCDWALMAILGRTGQTSARLRFNVGPGAALEIPTMVDWADWPVVASEVAVRMADWQREYSTLVERQPIFTKDFPFKSDPFGGMPDDLVRRDLLSQYFRENSRD
jgi:proteasome lid subunit RPN8/RPN11